MLKISGLLLPGSVPVVFLGVALGFAGTLSLFPAKEKQPQAPARFAASILLGEHRYTVRCLAFAPDGKTLATGAGFSDVPGEIKLWDLDTLTERATLQGQVKGIEAMEFSPDGRTLATVDVNGALTLWDATTGQALGSMPVSLPHSVSLALAPDGLTLAVARLGGDSNGVRLWQVATDKEHPLVGGPGPIRFSADGRRLALWRLAAEGESSAANPAYGQGFIATGNFGELPAVQAWDIPLHQEMRTLRGHEKFIWALAFSPDGTTLATAGFDETVKLWDVQSGQEQATLRGHTDQIGVLAFAPDGKLLASGSHDTTVRLWDPRSGRHVATLRGHRGTITCLGFAPDGQWIASGGHDKTVRISQRAEAR